MRLRAALMVAAWSVSLLAPRVLSAEDWPSWRGPLGTGVAPGATPPLRWEGTEGARWGAVLGGAGSSTPIVWRGRVVTTTAIDTGRAAPATTADPRAKTRPPGRDYQFVVICLDFENGRELWRRVVAEGPPHEGIHETHSYAAASPTTDGERIYVSFGSRGVYALDFDGQVLWSRDLGDMRTRFGWGEGVSPVVHDGRLLVNWDQEDDSYLYALDAATGATRWRVDRPGEPTTWATPLVVPRPDGRTQVVVTGTGHVRGYDLANGALLWRAPGLTVNAIPTPVATDELVICMSGYQGQQCLAIPRDAQGELEASALRWSRTSSTPYVPSPALADGRLYFTKGNTPVLTCLVADNGRELVVERRLESLRTLYASPLIADGRLYLIDREGTTLVLSADDRLEPLAVNRLGLPVDASPVAVGTRLLLRARDRIVCLE